MKLEYLCEGAPECPLIRIFGFTSEEARRLHGAVSALALDELSVAVHGLSYVQTIDSCRLTLQIAEWDQGIMCASDKSQFICRMTPETWRNVAGLIEPFANDSEGFQWLAGTPGIARLLMSRSGQW